MLSVCFGLYIDVLSASIRFDVIFCIYDHIQKYMFGNVEQLKNIIGMRQLRNKKLEWYLICKDNYIMIRRLITITYQIRFKIVSNISPPQLGGYVCHLVCLEPCLPT